jgi:signal transduction histidine kinase
MTAPDENTIRKITRIVDFARQLETDVRQIISQIEPIVADTGALREAADKAGMNKRQRLALGDAVSKSIREGLE